LGLLGFSTATFAAESVIAGWWPEASLLSVLFCLAVGYAMLSAGYFAQQPNNTSLADHVSGSFLIVSATLAFSSAAAVTINSAFRRVMLPLGSRYEYRRAPALMGHSG
jgi:succinate-acetate transporter protein